MRILIATDAWHPQVNGVVRSLETMARAIGAMELRRKSSILSPPRAPAPKESAPT